MDRSNGQTLATLSATTRQNKTAILGRHTCTETMGAGALDSAWLESTFHDAYLIVTEAPKVVPVK